MTNRIEIGKIPTPIKIALRTKIGNYFTFLEGEEVSIYQVRRDNVNTTQRAHYIGSLDDKIEAEGLVKKLNAKDMNDRQLHEYLEKKENERLESNAITDNIWGYQSPQ